MDGFLSLAGEGKNAGRHCVADQQLREDLKIQARLVALWFECGQT
ncbi:hypothetical protein AAHD62_09065 [Enterobacter hormaechei]